MLAGSCRARAIAARGARGVPVVSRPWLQAAGAAPRRRCYTTADRTLRPTEPEHGHGVPTWGPFLLSRGYSGRSRSESTPWSRQGGAVRTGVFFRLGQFDFLLLGRSGLQSPGPFFPAYFCNPTPVGQIIGMTDISSPLAFCQRSD